MSGYLSNYRVLDLTDHRGVMAGHILARLGADVIQLEPPAGSSARRQPPFAPAGDEAERSFYWMAFGAGKRSVTCDPDTPEGRALLEALVSEADFLIESTPPSQGRPDWLDYGWLSRLNPRIIQVSITPFGLSGPKAAWADTELTLWAASGPLLLTRGPDGRPLRMSVPQAYHHAASDAASAALLAHFARIQTGLGQQVEVSVLESVPQSTLSAVLAAAVNHPDFSPRPPPPGAPAPSPAAAPPRKTKWRLADGLCEMILAGGPGGGPSANQLFAWIRETGALPPGSCDFDWVSLPETMASGAVTPADVEAAMEIAARFLEGIRKSQIMDEAVARGIRMAPIETMTDLLESAHLADRGFFKKLDGAVGAYTLPGDFALGPEDAFGPLRPAPRLGEHTAQVTAWLRSRPPAGATASPALGAARAQTSAPLAGVRVLDLAWVVAGPLIGRTLADFGACVVRIDSSRRVETARLMGPFPGGVYDVQQCGLYENTNAGKLGLSLDLRHPEAHAVVRDLAAWADIAVESFTPGQMARWGLDYAALRQINPGLIMVSTSLMGQSGRHARYSGYGNHGAAISGFQNIVGPEGGPPVGPYGPYTDFLAPRFGLPAVLSALDHRRRTGQGVYLDVSQSEAGMQFLAPQIAEASMTGRSQGCAGNRDPGMAPHGVFAAKGWDSWVAIAVADDEAWLRLARAIGEARLLEDPDLRSLEGRRKREAELEAAISAWTRTRTAEEIVGLLQENRVAAHLAVASEDFIRDPQLLSRGHFVRLPHPLSGEAVIEASHMRLSRTPAAYPRSAPVYGRDNATVLREILRYDEARIARLVEADILA